MKRIKPPTRINNDLCRSIKWTLANGCIWIKILWSIGPIHYNFKETHIKIWELNSDDPDLDLTLGSAPPPKISAAITHLKISLSIKSNQNSWIGTTSKNFRGHSPSENLSP